MTKFLTRLKAVNEPADDADNNAPDDPRLLDAWANLDHAHGQIEYLTEKAQGLALTVKELRGDLTAVARGCDALAEQALPNLGTPTWPQTDQPCPAVIADQLAAEQHWEHCDLCGNWMPADEYDGHMDRHDAETAAPKAASKAAPKTAKS